MRAVGKVRIIAGKWRGRKLDVINSPGLRPTPDRVRETLFNWLQQDIVGARCLDLFAGTGALAFEALSRGAAEVFMIESNPKIVETLKLHAETLGSAGHTIQLADAISWLKQGINGFDIIFLDPPFGEGYIEQCCVAISEESLLKPKGLVYIESEKKLALPNGWEIRKQTKAGNVQSMLIEPV
ncbi:MAG: ribosomal RNA small subunit methyltransferase D [marine bacterium B5-7]|nr:MAG: ribosomal RNA small subunit methyltransferase D [marine bacterium B5-7]